MINVDERGVPVVLPGESAARECPPKPCDLCDNGGRLVLERTSWTLCQYLNTCAATIDWDKVYGHDD